MNQTNGTAPSRRLSTLWRITVGLVCLTLSAYLVARSLGLLPDRLEATVQGRVALCEALAFECSILAERGDVDTTRRLLKAIVARNSQVRSAGLRTEEGVLLAEVGPHRALWSEFVPGHNTAQRVLVPIFKGGRQWGGLELAFSAPEWTDPLGLVTASDLRTAAFLVVFGGLCYYLYLKKVLHHLNPSKVIPQRVRNTLNTLAEGLLVLDAHQRIILANESFARTVGCPADDLQGRSVAELRWSGAEPQSGKAYPWARAIERAAPQVGEVLKLENTAGTRVFKVNSTPLLADNGACLGSLTSFDDVTLLEERNATLADMLRRLQKSRDLIHSQNEQLRVLATRDSLTGCLNRRAFFELAEKPFQAARRDGRPLCCGLLDVDHFKAVNDTHGHRVGDQVLQTVAVVLREVVGSAGTVGRYGGEEFCIVLPEHNLDEAQAVLETVRTAIAGRATGGVRVTASLGLALLTADVRQLHDLLERADQALYAAKGGGRDRVVCWQPGLEGAAEMEGRNDVGRRLPDRSVDVLLACLRSRSAAVAGHCERVAALCLAACPREMTSSQKRLLEVAALLHDVGMLAVPDAVLMRPGALSAEDWKAIRRHAQTGVELLERSFDCPELVETVRLHHAWFGGSAQHETLPTGKAIPFAARLLSIAEAYDSMTVEQVYRRRMGVDEAFAELRRSAPAQFDPELVEQFIAAVTASDATRGAQIKTAALELGLLTEQLAAALGAQDGTSVAATAECLRRTAAAEGLDPIAHAAAQLAGAIDAADWVDVVTVAADLLELCRGVQSRLIAGSSAARGDVAPATSPIQQATGGGAN